MRSAAVTISANFAGGATWSPTGHWNRVSNGSHWGVIDVAPVVTEPIDVHLDDLTLAAP